MSAGTLVRFDEDHFGYLMPDLHRARALEMAAMFGEAWPGKKLIVIQADTFIDLTGQYEIVPIPQSEAVSA